MTEQASGVFLDTGDTVGQRSSGEVAEGLRGVATDPGSRSALAAVRDEGPLCVSELAARLARDGGTLDGNSSDEHLRTSIALRHCHLPRLADAGLVEVERDGESITVRASEEVDATTLDRIEALVAHEQGELLLSVLIDADRRYVAEHLALSDEAVPMSALAETIASRVDVTDEPYEAAVESARVSLHHIHLPALEEAGLVEYDPVERRVVPLDFPESLWNLLIP